MSKRLVSTAAAVVLFGGASLTAYGCGESGMKATEAPDDENGVKMSTMAGSETGGLGGNALAGSESEGDSGILLVEEAGTDQ